MCRNDDLSWLLTNRLSVTYQINENENKIKSSESFSKQPTQLIVELNSSLRHIIVTMQVFQILMTLNANLFLKSEMIKPLEGS